MQIRILVLFPTKTNIGDQKFALNKACNLPVTSCGFTQHRLTLNNHPPSVPSNIFCQVEMSSTSENCQQIYLRPKKKTSQFQMSNFEKFQVFQEVGDKRAFWPSYVFIVEFSRTASAVEATIALCDMSKEKKLVEKDVFTFTWSTKRSFQTSFWRKARSFKHGGKVLWMWRSQLWSCERDKKAEFDLERMQKSDVGTNSDWQTCSEDMSAVCSGKNKFSQRKNVTPLVPHSGNMAS